MLLLLFQSCFSCRGLLMMPLLLYYGIIVGRDSVGGLHGGRWFRFSPSRLFNAFFFVRERKDVFATSQFWSFRGSLVTEKESILLIFDALWFVRFSCPYFLLSRPHNTVANIKITRESVRLNMSCMLILLVGIYTVYTYFETSRLSCDFWDYY